jgi:hypothetical protein
MRDLQADLELINRATPGPWTADLCEIECFFIDTDECPRKLTDYDDQCTECEYCEFISGAYVPETKTVEYGDYTDMNDNDALFVAAAREGWPHAIERAMKAEARVAELKNAEGCDGCLDETRKAYLAVCKENGRLWDLVIGISEKLASFGKDSIMIGEEVAEIKRMLE